MKYSQLYLHLQRRSRALYLGMFPALAMLVAGIYGLVYATGGTKYVYVQVMYLPILLGGLVYGFPGGVLTAIAGGLALGPLMPLDVAGGEWQNTASWIFRMGFFVFVGGLAGFGRDALHAHVRHLQWIAGHDVPSGLRNRTALLSALRRLETRGGKNAASVLGIVSIQNSGELSSAFGFEVIEDNIQKLAERAALHLPGETQIFRVATEQIGFLGQRSAIRMPAALHDMNDAFRQPFLYNGIPVHIDTRIGYVSIADVGEEPENYLRKAEAALLLASQRDHEVAAYHSGIRRQAHDNLAVLGDLMGGLQREELQLHYQPKVSIRTGAVCGVEALMRWNHRDRGMIPPGTFIPRAEQSSLIHTLTGFAIEQALKQAVAWRDAGIHIPVAVNVSPRNLQRPGFAAMVMDMLDRCEASAELLELEVTEGALIGDVDRVVEELQQLAGNGIRLAIDDFGTGYSSLTYIHRLPVSSVKIDQSFIRGLLDSSEKASTVDLVEAVVSVAHKKGIETVAEGVESHEVYELLRNLGCDIAQGYAIARPMPARDFKTWHQEWHFHPGRRQSFA